MRAPGTKSDPAADGTPDVGRAVGEASARVGSRFEMAEPRRGAQEGVPAPDVPRLRAFSGKEIGIP